MTYKKYLSPIAEIIKDAKNGKMCIIVDDENRENEGDLVIPAEFANSEAVNFMAKHGRGLICLAMQEKRIKKLNLPLMSSFNNSRYSTAFTVSIEAREGVSTGISAADRARTIEVAIDPAKDAQDICSPGHVFPLVARKGGVLTRAGHTEAAVDIAKLAGLNSAGVICEIMNDDGTMARMPDLIKFAEEHSLKIATIADLIAYRRKNENLIKRELESTITSLYGGEFKTYIYISTVEYAEHIVLVKGEINSDKPVLVRMHSQDVLGDALGDVADDRQGTLQKSLELIAKEGSGVVVLLRTPKRDSVTAALRARQKPHKEKANHTDIIRDYGTGAQILLDLGVKQMTLLTNSKKAVIGLEGYGLEICGYKKVK
jgi:3,4-dihydroxy 2-butanone 4-phosphate synthase/GTP cyclohydrolase II